MATGTLYFVSNVLGGEAVTLTAFMGVTLALPIGKTRARLVSRSSSARKVTDDRAINHTSKHI